MRFYPYILPKPPKNYSLGTKLSFSAGDDKAIQAGGAYFASGLSHEENWGTWTDGNALYATLWLDSIDAPIAFSLNVEKVYHQSQPVTIKINNKNVFEGVIENAEDDINFVFTPDKNFLCIEIEIPNSVRPSKVASSADKRKLGIGISSISLDRTTVEKTAKEAARQP